jgi:hypothetical protein
MSRERKIHKPIVGKFNNILAAVGAGKKKSGRKNPPAKGKIEKK